MDSLDTDNLVRAAYRAILSREPDEAGRQTWKQRADASGPEAVLSGLIKSEEFRRRFLLDQVNAKGLDGAKWITNWLVHLLIGSVLHPPRLELVRKIVPAGSKVLDLGGASGKPEGAFLEMGYPHAKDLTIVDLPLEERFKSGPAINAEFTHCGTIVRYAYHSMADLSAYEDESFDLVWSGQTYEHISEEEGLNLFPQIARVLKRGGHFAMDTPNRAVTRITVGEDIFVHAEHKIEYFYEDFVNRFSDFGLKLIDRRGVLNMPETLRNGHAILNELLNNVVNYTPETSYCFYLAYQKP